MSEDQHQEEEHKPAVPTEPGELHPVFYQNTTDIYNGGWGPVNTFHFDRPLMQT